MSINGFSEIILPMRGGPGQRAGRVREGFGTGSGRVRDGIARRPLAPLLLKQVGLMGGRAEPLPSQRPIQVAGSERAEAAQKKFN